MSETSESPDSIRISASPRPHHAMKIPRLPAGEIARRAVQATESIEAAKIAKTAAIAAQKASGIKQKQTPRPEHGQQIFVFNHLQKNHVVYSLTRAMNNNAALAQLPFNGKKSVPAALRKDLWHAFAQIKFPSGSGEIGLSAFQKLREYRKRHELEWSDDIRLDSEGKNRSLKDRGKAICNQKANSVADIAAVLNRLAAKDVQQVHVVKSDEKILEGRNKGFDPELANEEREKRYNEDADRKKSIGLIGEGSGTQVQILWGDIHDAEYAEKWNGNIEHDLMPAPQVRESKPWASRKKDPRALEEGEQEQDATQISEEAAPVTLEPTPRPSIPTEAEKLEAKRAAQHARREARDAFLDAQREASDAATCQQLNITQGELTARRLAKLQKQQAVRELYEQKQAENERRKRSDPEWYERVKAEGLKRKAEKGLL